MAAPCIIKRSDGRYLKKPRTGYGKVSWVENINDARVFTTKSTASLFAGQARQASGEVKIVKVSLVGTE